MYGSIRGPSPAPARRSARCAAPGPKAVSGGPRGCSGTCPAAASTDEPFSLRWIYTHMIEEYARHNGHADLIRERIDGFTGE